MEQIPFSATILYPHPARLTVFMTSAHASTNFNVPLRFLPIFTVSVSRRSSDDDGSLECIMFHSVTFPNIHGNFVSVIDPVAMMARVQGLIYTCM